MQWDIEADGPAEQAATAIVTVADMQTHLRMSGFSGLNTNIEDALDEAVAAMHGPLGILNRTVLRQKWKLYRRAFPAGAMQIPYPPLISVESVTYVDGSGVEQTLDAEAYIVRAGDFNIEPTIELVDGEWPGTKTHPRAVTISFTAGWAAFPKDLRRAVKILAAHYVENPEASVTENRITVQNKKIVYGLDDCFSRLTVPLAYGGIQE